MKRRKDVNRRAATMQRDGCIYGTHAVQEWVRANSRRLRTLYYDPSAMNRLAPIITSARTAAVALQPCTGEQLTAMGGTSRHQGIVATTASFPYVELASLVDQRRVLVVADQLQDPQNFGALLRTSNATGVGGVIIPKDGAVSVTATVEAAAAGASAHVPVCRVTNTVRALETLKQAGYWLAGLMPSDGVDLYDLDIPAPAVVVVGGESGMRPLVAKNCDFKIRIPMVGVVESLNASVAAAVVLYELLRRSRDHAKGH